MARNMKCPHSGKDVFFTEQAAEQAVATYQRKRGAPPLRVYRCPDCGYRHLTKNLTYRPRTAAEMFVSLVGEVK